MSFLLNKQVEIFSVILKEDNEGGFVEEEASLGLFFASVLVFEKESCRSLSIITRESPLVKGKLRVSFLGEKYNLLQISQFKEGFIKLFCERKKY